MAKPSDYIQIFISLYHHAICVVGGFSALAKKNAFPVTRRQPATVAESVLIDLTVFCSLNIYSKCITAGHTLLKLGFRIKNQFERHPVSVSKYRCQSRTMSV